MKNKLIISSTSAIAGMALGYMLKGTVDNFNNGHEDANQLKQVIEKAGNPSEIESIEHEQLENAKMVSEGSQFGVQYYNEYRDENIYDEAGLPKLE